MSLKLDCTISEVLSMVSGQISAPLDHSFLLRNIASLEKAGPHDIGVIFDREENGVFKEKSDKAVKQSKAAVLLTSRLIDNDDRCLMVNDALAAYEKLVFHAKNKTLKKEHSLEAPIVHSTAFVDDTAVIGIGSVIGPQVFIGANVIIGAHVTLNAGVKILDRCQVGDYTIIHPGTVVGSDGYRYIVTKQGMRKVPQIGIVRIGKWVEIGANCCIDRAGFDETVLEDGVKLDNLVHIAHNVHIGAHTAIIAQTGIAGGARIGMGCQIGGQVAIKDHVTIGNGVKIVSKTAVLKDLADKAVVAGIPAISFSRWKRLSVILLKLPEWSDSMKKLQTLLVSQSSRRWWHCFFGK